MARKKQNPKETREEREFERELNKLKLSAEHGIPFSERKEEEPQNESEEEFFARMREFEEAMENPDNKSIKDLLGNPNFPKEENLTDAELTAALELLTTALANKSIVLDVLYPTPEREIYRFITEELFNEDSGMAGAGGMTSHFIYEEFHPNHTEDIKDVIHDTLHYICGGHKASMPWRIDNEVQMHGELISEEAFRQALANHRHVFSGMHFIGVDSVKINIKKSKANAKAKFRFYLDKSSGQPGEISAEAEFHFILSEDTFWLSRLIINHFGIE